MRYENLLDPISDDQPCGPDMELDGDDDFIDYYYEALARIPERFVSPNGEAFDRRSIDLKGEVAQIEGLLGRTVDLRLLVLEAKFQALAGKIEGFCDILQISAKLLEERWTDVHPQVGEDVTERRNQLELLDDRSTIVMPLEHAPLIKDRRIDEISLRGYQVARGEKEARTDEPVGDAGSMQSALRSAENAEAVDAVFGHLSAGKTALESIKSSCMLADGVGFSPTLGNLEGILNTLIGFLTEARPDLLGEGDGEETEGEDGEAVEGDGTDGEGGASETVAVRPAGDVPNHHAASAALLTVESYFARCEPSAPGLLLIRQARKLIGKPLTEAIDTLLPSVSGKAIIDFGSETGFQLDAAKMRELAADTSDVDAAMAPPDDIPEYVAESRTEAMNLLGKVESYFRQFEPSSPVPVLLFKAKNYMNRDFSAIVSELFAVRE